MTRPALSARTRRLTVAVSRRASRETPAAHGPLSLALAMLALAAGCANPLPPTGGPEDRTPPRLVRAAPDTNAVNVASGTVRLVFSEPLDAASVARSLSVTPDLDRPPEVEVRRRREVVVRLGALRPNTTYVLAFDATLRDERSVPLASPVVYAFSTGPRISRGVVAGRVVDATTGLPRAGVEVLAYAGHTPAADTLPRRPTARTQTGQNGAFRLGYLGPAPLYVVALDDRNRNRAPDAGEAFAVPPAPLLRPSDTAPDSSLTWTMALPDTARARAERARSFGPARHAVRFSRPVFVREASGWTVRDSSGQTYPVRAVWRDDGDARQVQFATDALAPRPLTVQPGAVVDSLGRTATGAAPLRFAPSAARDTLRARFLGFSDATVEADSAGRARPRVRFSRAFDAASEGAPTGGPPIAVTDTLGRPQPFALALADDGPAYDVATALPALVRVDARSLGADTTFVQRFDARSERTLGSLSGRIERPAGTTGAVVVEAVSETGRRTRALAAPDGTFVVARLPAGPYRLVAFVDQNGDGRWTPGRLAPYRAPEPLVRLGAPQAVRARWDAALPDTLRF